MEKDQVVQLKGGRQGGLILTLWMITLLDWVRISRNLSQFFSMSKVNVGLSPYAEWVVWARPLLRRKYIVKATLLVISNIWLGHTFLKTVKKEKYGKTFYLILTS
ncbi:hypothetical protein E1A91_D11G337000v1 [Gossypium mustelinum]|uniref:Uncharacterized protein n=1 Tax=Gossypium mustelinum TaxID=34275 RepID=A0A5D2T0L0_GOSMU|nr:hypothetical protein E1A91_D11G337000v1 [Gossypium mustelinum]